MNKIILLLTVSFIAIQLYSQDSLNMERVGQWNPSGMPVYNGVKFNDVWGYTASDGTEYGIIGNVDSVMIINLADPSLPVREYGFYGGGHAIWRDFKIHNDHLFAVCDGCSEGMHIFDLSALPAGEVEHVVTIDTFFTKAHNIFIDTSTQKLYAAGSNGAVEGLVVIDVSNPEVPVRLSNHIFDEVGNFYVHDVYVKNDTAYCSHGWTGYYVWDMTDLSQVVNLGSYDSPGYNHSSWNDKTGRYAYYAEEVPLGRPMAVVDLDNLGHPTEDIEMIKLFRHPISNSVNNVTPHNPFVKGDSLYISYYEDGVKVYGLTNPENPNLVAYYDTYSDNGSVYTGYEGAWGCYPFLPSGHILVSDISYGLNIVKVQECANPITYFRDRDEDGFGNPNNFASSCSVPAGYVTNNLDCDDTDATRNPNATEVCDGVDNNCNGLLDQDDPAIVYDIFYQDSDNDGYGNPLVTVEACQAPDGYVDNSDDCDDNNIMVNPGFVEICDNIDNDCDGLIDQDDNDLGNIEWYLDSDGDGYGNDMFSLFECAQPDNYVFFGGDCDDDDANNFPGNLEICDGQDNNCDGIVDESCPTEPCDDINLYINPITQAIYRAKENIISDAVTTTGTDISFYSGLLIEMSEGFEVVSGSSFTANIEDCDEGTVSQPVKIEDYDSFVQNKKEELLSDDVELFIVLKDREKAYIEIFTDLEEARKSLSFSRGKTLNSKLYVFKEGDLIKEF